MFRPGVNGIGNLFMQLTQVDTVSEKFLTDGKRSRYIRLKNIRVVSDDFPLDSVVPKLHVGLPCHHRIRDIMEPNEHMNSILDKYKHLVDEVTCGIQIRRCGLSKTLNELTPDASFCTDETLETFHHIIETSKGPVFVTSDCHAIKHEFKDRWPHKVRILDEVPTHTSSVNENSDPWVAFTEFFLLSMCPAVFVTGGETEHYCHMSTFGYMAAVYGDKPYKFIFNS